MAKIKENLSLFKSFNEICRICLQSDEDMVDIFKSGMDVHLMEVTNLQVQQDDNFPKSLCLNCICELDCFYKFLHKAKASDSYLRSLLTDSENNDKEDVHETLIEEEKNLRKSSKKKLERWSKRSSEDKFKKYVKNEKMYLIFVPNASDANSSANNQICIRDVSCINENIEISQFCRSLIQKTFSDHTYPKDSKEFCVNPSEECQEDHSLIVELASNDVDPTNQSKICCVNLAIYECSKCCEYFEESDDLTNHYLVAHNCQPPISQFLFKCPVCFFEENNKIAFLKHLECHKATGILFMKVNGAGEKIFIKNSEKDIFNGLHCEDKKISKVFKINLSSTKCPDCGEEFESEYLIQKHAYSCFASKKFELDFYISYHCPICNEPLKDKKSFLNHLALHKDTNYYYIMVNNFGEPIKFINSNKIFLPFEEAVEVMEFLKGDSSRKFFKITNNCSCDKCDFESESFNLLHNHYNVIHGEKALVTTLFVCPVCLVQYNKDSLEENKLEFFEHLKEHKNNGLYFINVKRNGSCSSLNKIYPDIFSQSSVLCDLINSNSCVTDQICCPELVIINDKNTKLKYTCDLCQKRFKRKQDIIKHFKSHNKKKKSSDSLRYICEKCGKKFLSKKSYEKHFFKHSKAYISLGKRATCSICHKTFANRGTLNGHIGQHLKEGIESNLNNSLINKICEKCGKSFSNNASLTKHKKLHTKDKENALLKCEICNREFLRQSSFDRHKSGHLNPNYFECEICKLPLSSVLSLQKHLESHQHGSNTYDCKACKISFLTKDSLTAHQTHTGHYLDRKPLECNVCHEKFFIGRKFTQHIKTHPKYKIGECTLCGKKLSTVHSLMLHMGRHFESNCILCPHCGKQIFEEKNYHRHLLTHEGIKPFSCDVESCEKSFYTLFELNRHKKYHNNTRDFNCPYCSKSFHEANHLTVHIRTHTGERPYKCPHCNKGFVTRTRCKYHIKLNHQGIGYDLIQSKISKKVTVFEAVENA